MESPGTSEVRDHLRAQSCVKGNKENVHFLTQGAVHLFVLSFVPRLHLALFDFNYQVHFPGGAWG